MTHAFRRLTHLAEQPGALEGHDAHLLACPS